MGLGIGLVYIRDNIRNGKDMVENNSGKNYASIADNNGDTS